jgi:glucose/arabinose dehydrogenase
MRDTVGASGYTPANNASAIDQRVVTSPAFSSSAANLAAAPLLDLSSQLAFGAEKGVLSLALHPQFANAGNAHAGKLYVSYTTAPLGSGEHDLVIAEYRISATNTNLVDVTSRRELLRVSQPFATNVGGTLAFGPDDGWLYIGLGDGGGVNDPQGHAQNLNSLLGKVLRVDVNGTNGPGGAYGIPASNPFVGQSGKRGEILAFGFRHPDAFSFAENSTGEDRLFVSDRGSSQREELNLVTAGGNYAWPYLEGTHLIQSGAPLNVVAPIAEYAHTAYGMSARGGLLYQGSKQGNLLEQYLWADHSGRLFALAEGTTGWNFQSTHPLFNGDPRGRLFYALTADAAGDVYLATADTIYKLRAQLPDWLQVNPRTGELNALAADADLGVYSFRITARDQAGQSVSDDFNWTITATSQPPRITSNGGGATANVSVNENSTTVTTVVASDPDTSDSVALSLESTQGADRALFSLNPLTGVLNFLVPPNHESPADADQNNQYQVVVAATDSAGHRTTQALTVTVVNVNEPPLLAKNLAATGAEGGTFPITSATLQVTDPDNTAAEIAFAVTTSPANGKLELSTNPGVAVTSFTQNDVNLGRLLYRHSGSETTSDRFDFTVMDGAGGSLAAQQFQLAITPVNDLPVMVANQPITVLEGTAQSLSATDLLISDVDNTAAQLMFTVTAAPSRGQLEFTTNPGAAISSFKQSDVDNQRVRYRHDGSETSSDAFTFSVTDGAGGTLANLKFNLAITPVNDQAPVMTSVSTVTKLENGTSVLSLSATDADLPTQPLSYAITGGADALLFSIHATTGTLAFLNAPNFEQPADADRNNSYQLVVAANDGAGLSTSQNLTVNVANLNEPPIITSYGGGETASLSVLENSPGAMGISAKDPENASQVLSYRLIGGADQSRFNLGGFTGTLTFKTPPDFENPTDLDRNNVYEIRLRVSDGQGGVDEQTLLITVNNVIVNTTTVQINGSGNLEIKDSAAKNDDLLISRSGNDLVIQDRSQRAESEIAVSGIPSAVLNLNKKTVQIPVAMIEATNKPLLISTGWGDDLVQLDTANSFSSDPLPSTGFQLNLGAGKDRLDFVNNPTANNWVLGGMQAGYVQLGSLGTLEFTGLEIAQGGSGKDVFKLANASSANGFLLIDGDLGSTQDAIEIARDANMTLTNSLLDVKAQSASFVDQTYSLANILQATLTGGNSNNLLDASFFTGSVVLNGGEGNDVLFGGSGNDQLNGGNGHDWLSGNGGDDKLQGNNGRDILVGGLGSDRLNEASVPASGAGDDILIGGRTSYDTNKIAIDTLLIAWQSTASYLLRVTQIRNTGVGSSLYKLNALSVFDDNTLDTLFGGSETDWYFAKVLGTQGDAHDASTNEQLTGL